jgi:hypothetical protein
MMTRHLLLALLVYPFVGSAQADTSASTLIFSGYAEVYYAYDFNKPADHNRPSFLYSHNRHNEFNLNLGFLKGAYTTERVRANLALAAGTYINANYASEPGVLKNLFEANAGIKLSKNNNLWVDVGIFSSHIGFESAVSKDCWGLTRSMLAENSPYYESGAKVTYITKDSKWLLSVLYLNGWQHIQRPDGNNTPAFGAQFTFTPNEKITLNYSNFFGNDKPDEVKQSRCLHNVYGIFHFTDKFHLTAGLDFGREQKETGSSDYYHWYSPVLIARFLLDEKWSVTGRGEFYSDVHGVIIPTGTENGFQTTGYSLNLDYHIRENAVWRIEGRMLVSKDDIFLKDNTAVNTNTCMTTSITVSF